jgi:hypothetical protein
MPSPAIATRSPLLWRLLTTVALLIRQHVGFDVIAMPRIRATAARSAILGDPRHDEGPRIGQQAALYWNTLVRGYGRGARARQ